MRGYDNPYWEYHLPINPAIEPGKDLDPETFELYEWTPSQFDNNILNWTNDQGELEFRPRLRDNVQLVSRFGLADDDEATELDMEYDD
jgi:hypothetical protein